MTAKKPKIFAAVARLDAKPRKPRRAQAIRQQRQAAAWQAKTAAAGAVEKGKHA